MNSNQNNNINNNEMKTGELVASNNNIGGFEENKQEQQEDAQNEALEEEELKSYLYNEDQFKEFTYILIKNFEAQKLESKKLTVFIFKIRKSLTKLTKTLMK
jgi:hypothetical protein